MEEKQFDFEAFKKEAIDKLKTGKGLADSERAFTPLIKSFLEEALGAELEAHLDNETVPLAVVSVHAYN